MMNDEFYAWFKSWKSLTSVWVQFWKYRCTEGNSAVRSDQGAMDSLDTGPFNMEGIEIVYYETCKQGQ